MVKQKSTPEMCDVLGCTLQRRHAGMHLTKILSKPRRCHGLNRLQMTASKRRKDMLINVKISETAMIKSHLECMKRQIQKHIDQVLALL
jgi:hypothetical protein